MIVVRLLARRDTNDTDDELSNDHAQCTVNQDEPSAETLDHPEGKRRGADVDQSGDQGDQEGVGDGSERGEKDGSKVEDEIDTGQLLHHLHEDSNGRTTTVAAAEEHRSLEAVGPASDVTGLGDDLHFVLVVGNDFGQFILDEVRVHGLSANVCEGLGGLFELAFLDKVTGRFGEEEKTGPEDDGPEELQSNGNPVRSGVISMLGTVDDAVGEQDANRNAELVAGHDRTADFPWGNLRHVEDDDGGDESHAGTCDQTAHDHDGEACGRGFQDTANGEDEATCDDGESPTNEIGDVTGDDGAEERTGGQDGCGERLVTSGEMEIRDGDFVVGVRIGKTGVLADEVPHGQNASHPARVISKEDATKGGKSAHEIGLDGDGGLDTFSIGGPRDDHGSSRHDGGFKARSLIVEMGRVRGRNVSE